MAHDFLRVRRVSRQSLRIGHTNISNQTDGSSVDLNDPFVLRDLRLFRERYVVLGPLEAGADAHTETLAPNDAIADLTVTSGVILWTAIELPKGLKVAGLTYYTGSTGFTAGTSSPTTNCHKFFGFYSSDGTTLTQQAVTADDINNALSSASPLNLSFTTAYTTLTASTYYLAYLLNAGSGGSPAAPTLTGAKPLNAAVANVDGTKLFGTSETSAVALPATELFSAVTATNLIPYVVLG